MKVGPKIKDSDAIAVVRVCKVHGPLTIGDLRKKGGRLTACSHCLAATRKRTYEKNKQSRLERAAKFRAENREKLAKWAKEDRKKNPQKYAEASKRYSRSLKDVLRERGLSFDEYEALVVEHDNRCAICHQEETRKTSQSKDKVMRLCIDHSHDTGKVRGLLCHCCNTALGKLKDSLQLLESSIVYLKKYGVK